jgi:hypothetical protein
VIISITIAPSEVSKSSAGGDLSAYGLIRRKKAWTWVPPAEVHRQSEYLSTKQVVKITTPPGRKCNYLWEASKLICVGEKFPAEATNLNLMFLQALLDKAVGHVE